MANLTIAVDDDVLHRARVRAVRERTSVNAVLRKHLERFALGAGAVGRARRELIELSQRVQGRSGASRRKWTREELHER